MSSIFPTADLFVCLGGLLTMGLLGVMTVAFSYRRGPFASRDSENAEARNNSRLPPDQEK